MDWVKCTIMGRQYRYSAERWNTGRPRDAQYFNPKYGWRRVRSSNTLSRIWDVSEGKPVDLISSRICKHINIMGSYGIWTCMDCEELVDKNNRSLVGAGISI